MSTMTLIKNEQGEIVGFHEKDRKAWARFKRLLHKLEIGELLTLDYWFPRHGKFHRLHFVMLTTIWDSQERFQYFEHLRDWLTIGAGHAVFAPGPDGKTMAFADSISYKRLDDEEFHEHHERVKDFMRTEYAQRTLWPALPPAETSEMVELILRQFEREITGVSRVEDHRVGP